MVEEWTNRGQVGIGTLIVFIAMVLVAAIAAGVLINTAGFLQSQSEETGQQSSDQVTNRLQVLQASGLKTSQDNAVDPVTLGGVELIVSKGPGAADISLTGISMQWVDETGSYNLVHEDLIDYHAQTPVPHYTGSTSVDGAFAHEPIKDTDDSLSNGEDPVINSPDDRARVVIDVGRNDVLADNSIGEAYDNHTYNIQERDMPPVTDESELSSDAADRLNYDSIENDARDGVIEIDSSNYGVGTVIRSGVTYEGTLGVGMRPSASAKLTLTTQSGASSTVRLLAPASLSEKDAVQL